MQQLIKTRLFSLIKESAQRCVSVSEWEQSYESFASALFTASAKLDGVIFHNNLCYAKTELAFFESQDNLKKCNCIILHSKGFVSY